MSRQVAGVLSDLDRVGATRIAPPRLGAKDLVRLLVDALKSQRLADELVGRIAVKSDGNPYFVFEILRGAGRRPRLTLGSRRVLPAGLVGGRHQAPHDHA